MRDPGFYEPDTKSSHQLIVEHICYFITIVDSSLEFIYFYIMYYPFYAFVLQGYGSVNELTLGD